MTRQEKWIGGFVAAAILACLFYPLYFVDVATGDAYTYCNQKECTIFLSETRNGWRTNPLFTGIMSLMSALYVPYPPTDQKTFTTVLVLKPDGVWQATYSRDLSSWGVFHGEIYGGGEGGAWVWQGTGFRAISDSEKKAFDLGTHTEEVLWAGRLKHRGDWTATLINPRDSTDITLDGTPVQILREFDSQTFTMDLVVAQRTQRLWERPRGGHSLSRRQYWHYLSSPN